MSSGHPRVNPRMTQAAPMRRCLLEECHGACCLYGAWVDIAEVEEIQAHADLIRPLLPAEKSDPAGWFDGQREVDKHALSGVVSHTAVLPNEDHYGGTACVFLLADYRCALQVAAELKGYHPWRLKPFYCVLHPLDLDEQGRITLDEEAHLLMEPGSCLRPDSQLRPLAEIFAPELRYLLGEKGYRKMTITTKS